MYKKNILLILISQVLVLVSCDNKKEPEIYIGKMQERVSEIRELGTNDRLISIDSFFYKGERLEKTVKYRMTVTNKLIYDETKFYNYSGDSVFSGKNIYIIKDDQLIEKIAEYGKIVFKYNNGKLIKSNYFKSPNNTQDSLWNECFIYSNKLDSIVITDRSSTTGITYFYFANFEYQGNLLESIKWKNYNSSTGKYFDDSKYTYTYQGSYLIRITFSALYDNIWTDISEYNFEYNENCNLKSYWTVQQQTKQIKYVYSYENGKGNSSFFNWNSDNYDLQFPNYK
jgi:hypothetical protein